MWTVAVAYISSFNIWGIKFLISAESALFSSSLIINKEWWSFSASCNCLIKADLDKISETVAVWSELSEEEELGSVVND